MTDRNGSTSEKIGQVFALACAVLNGDARPPRSLSRRRNALPPPLATAVNRADAARRALVEDLQWDRRRFASVLRHCLWVPFASTTDARYDTEVLPEVRERWGRPDPEWSAAPLGMPPVDDSLATRQPRYIRNELAALAERPDSVEKHLLALRWAFALTFFAAHRHAYYADRDDRLVVLAEPGADREPERYHIPLPAVPERIAICLACGQFFVARRRDHQTCSPKCRQRLSRCRDTTPREVRLKAQREAKARLRARSKSGRR